MLARVASGLASGARDPADGKGSRGRLPCIKFRLLSSPLRCLNKGFFVYPRRKIQFGITPLKRPQFRSDFSQFRTIFVQIDRLWRTAEISNSSSASLGRPQLAPSEPLLKLQVVATQHIRVLVTEGESGEIVFPPQLLWRACWSVKKSTGIKVVLSPILHTDYRYRERAGAGRGRW
jgi:hypothetical protein